jgi:iron complex transport system permease protein
MRTETRRQQNAVARVIAALPKRGLLLARSALSFPIMFGVLGIAFLISISVGAASIPLPEVWRLVFKPDDSTNALIVQTLRLPRAVVALLVGSSLGVSAALLQSVTRNPLASPGILGVNAGAALGILVGVVFLPTLPSSALVLVAFSGGIGAALLTYSVTAAVGITPMRLALAGIAVGSLLAALTSGVQILFEERARGALFSLAGSLAGRTWDHVALATPWVGIGLMLALTSSQLVNLVSLGDDAAQGLGVNVNVARLWLAGLAVLLASAATSVAGPIGFLGLMSPHLARGLVGADYRLVVPMSALIGSSILLLADVGARVVDAPLETPVGILITAIGAPFFVLLARKLRRTH